MPERTALLRRGGVIVLLAVITATLIMSRFTMENPADTAAAVGAGEFFNVRDISPSASALPALPAWLRDTDVDGVLTTDASGELVVDIGLRRRFDYFLSVQGEADAAAIRALLRHSLAELSGDSMRRALAIFDRYLGLQQAMQRMAPHDGSLAGVRAAVEERNSLRRAWLGQEVAEAFFGFDDHYDAFVLARAAVLADNALSETQRAARIRALRDALPAAMQELIEAPHRPLQLSREVAALREQGASETDILRLREQYVGADAARRLAALDAERAAWQQRYRAYRVARARIDNSGLAEVDKQQAIVRLREQHFTVAEQRRVEVLEHLPAGADAAD